MTQALDISRKWVKRIGMGYHPDTRGQDYTPPLSAAEVTEYEADMDYLFNAMHGLDPYECGLQAMREIFPEQFK